MTHYSDPRPEFRPTTDNEEEIAWVGERIESGEFECYVVIEHAPGKYAVCGHYQHNGPYQQFQHMELGEQELDVWDDAGGGTVMYWDEGEVRGHVG